MPKITTIIYDLGGVLIDWNPKYVYRQVFNNDEKKADWFLNSICSHSWNEEHDAGRSIEEGNKVLIEQYPQHEKLIRTYYERWHEMLGGPIKEGVDILNRLKQTNSYKLYALTNWSAETFPIALQRYDFLQHFEGIVVSGEEKTRKPFAKIYEIIIERYHLKAASCVFIDDNYDNVVAAKKMGMHSIQFKNSQQLTNELNYLGIRF